MGVFSQQTNLKRFNPLKFKIKISILICWPYSFPTEVVGRNDKMSRKFILGDHVRNSHNHSVLQSIDITGRDLMLITLRASRVKRGLQQTLPPDKYLLLRVSGVKLRYRLCVIWAQRSYSTTKSALFCDYIYPLERATETHALF